MSRALFALWLALAAGSVALVGGASSPPVVKTPCGTWEGSWVDYPGTSGVAYFGGIEFTAEPTARFAHSVARTCGASNVTSVVNASTPGPACPQLAPFDAPQGTSEACQNLDVILPQAALNRSAADPLLPVIFWVFGGDNTIGWSNVYPGLPLLAEATGSVLIAPNYRLGALGYLLLDPATKITGNYGLGDLVAALEFIQPVLESVGGDASRVTVMGQSSGATNLIALLASPRFRPLFSRLISLSPSANITETASTAAAANTARLLPIVKCPASPPSQTRSCLMGLSTEAVMSAYTSNYTDGAPFPMPTSGYGRQGLVVVDGLVVTEAPIDALASGVAADKVLMFQTMRDETDSSNVTFDALPASEFEPSAAVELAAGGWAPSTAAAVAKLYAPEANLTNGTARGMAESWWTDIQITCGSSAMAAAARRGLNATKGSGMVFRSQVMQGPAAPFPFPGDTVALLPFHTFDFPTTGGNGWGFIASLFPGTPVYTPHPADIALGVYLRSVWSEIVNGQTPDGWSPTECNGVTKDGIVECATTLAGRCQGLADLGWGPSFWWVN